MSPILFGEDGWKWLEKFLRSNRVIVLCDENTEQCISHLTIFFRESQDIPLINIPAGEINKSLKTCEMVWRRLTELKADRNAILLNLGGGVVTDLGGFVASTYMRGIRFVHIPTSLMGMVDAAIGGKTGVDFDGLKNMIGTFSQPEAVIVDPSFLKTLPERELKSGFAEVLKHAFISEPSIIDLLVGDMDELIARSIEVKMDVVKTDEFETGERKKLNFGHTIGHAVESHFLNSDKPLLHGEAIAVGLVIEAYLSSRIVGLPEDQMRLVCEKVDSVFERTEITEQDWIAIKSLLVHDKKNHNGASKFVLIPRLGSAVFDQNIDEGLLDKACSFYVGQ